MQSEPTEPSFRSSRLAFGWEVALFIATAVSVCLSGLFFPIAPSDSLDSSWQLVLAHAWEHRFIFGQDIVYTYGPWGWLTTLYFHPATYDARVAWELLEKAAAAVLIAAFARHLATPRRAALVAACWLLLPLFQDTLPMLLIAGLVLWCSQPGRRVASLGAVGAALGFLALQKFTYLVMAAGGTAGLVALWLQRGDRGSVRWLVGSGAATVLVAWIAAGQPLPMLPLFLQRTGWIASGYPYAMYWDESAAVFRWGLACALLYLVVVWWRASRANLVLALILTAFGLLCWKHGFTRADGHTLGFFLCMVFAGIAGPWLNRSKSGLMGAVSWILVLAAVAGSFAAVPEIMWNVGPLLRLHWTENAQTLLHLPARRAQLERALVAQQTAHRLPATQAMVGQATIDQFGFEQAVLLFNPFNYRPRPVFQSFHAYSGSLAQLNESSYLGIAAPTFTLARLQTIDGRYPALDDATLLPRLVTDHDMAGTENGFLLLRRRTVAENLQRTVFRSGRLRYGTEEQSFRDHDGKAIWAKIDTPLSWIGWLRTFFYKPPAVRLVVEDSSGARNSFRLVVPAARAGFLLSPVLLDTPALERLITSRAGLAARRIRVEIDPADGMYFLKRARFEFSTLPALDFDAGAIATPTPP